MSRIGKKPIDIPDKVTVKTEGDKIIIKGPKGEMIQKTFADFNIDINDRQIKILARKDEDKITAMHGLLRSLIANAVTGVSEGFEIRLELVGTGYRVKKEGKKLSLSLGFSHPVYIEPIEGINLEIEGQKEIIVSGIDKQKVGQVAANIRSLRKPEPYKGKGIRYKDEIVRRKPGKAAKLGASQGGD